MTRQLAIVYGDESNKVKAEAIAAALKPGSTVIGSKLADLPRKPLAFYCLDSRQYKAAGVSRNYFVLDDDQPRVKGWRYPNMNNPFCILHVTQNPKLALIRPRTILMRKGMVERPYKTQGEARASLPVSKGKWVFVEDMESWRSQFLVKKYGNLGLTFVTVGDVGKKEGNKLWIRETGSNHETLWNVLMACDVIVKDDLRIPFNLYQTSGRQVTNVHRFSDVIDNGFAYDLEAGQALMAEKSYTNRAKVIARKIAEYVHYQDYRVLDLLLGE